MQRLQKLFMVRQTLGGLIIALLAIPPCQADPQRTFTKLLGYPPTSLDPVYGATNTDAALRADLFEPLITINAMGEYALGAAERMEILAGGQTYRFRLREGLRWSDGKSLTAYDFKTTIERIIDPAIGFDALPKNISLIGWLKNSEAISRGSKPVSAIGVETPSDRDIIFHLSKPSPFFDEQIAHALYPSPTHLIQQYGEGWSQMLPHVSNGPYRISPKQTVGKIVLEPNPFYRDNASLFFQRVEILFGEYYVAGQLIEKNAVDMVYDFVLLSNAKWAADKRNYNLHYGPDGPLTLVLFNLKDPALADQRVRRALQLATDVEQITTRLMQRFTGIRSVKGLFQSQRDTQANPLRPEWADWRMENRKAEARALLKNAGYSSDNPLTLRLHQNNRQLQRLVSNALASQWLQVGIRLQTIAQRGNKHYRDIDSGAYQLGLVSRQSKFKDPLDWLLLLAPHSSNNFTHWHSQPYGSLLDQIALLTKGSPARKTLIRQAQQMILEAAPLLPLFNVDTEPTILKKDILAPVKDDYRQTRFIRRGPQ